MKATEQIAHIIAQHYPTTQAIYLFGSYGTADEWPDSDVDVAVLLPPTEARRQTTLMLTACHRELADALGRPVDLINARTVATVFQKEIVASGRVIHCTDPEALAEFEMLTLSLYQKLNQERQAILRAFVETARAYAV